MLIRLEAENILGIKAVNLNLNGNSAYLKGPNGAGKTSILDTLALLIGLEKNSNPLKTGERRGKALAEFEDFTVEKEFVNGKTKSWKVIPKNGDAGVTPSEFFKNWIDDISFRPDNFIKKDKKSRVKALASAINIDIDKYDEDRKQIYDTRTEVNRKKKELEAKLKNLRLYKDVPDEELSSKELTKQFQEINEKRHQKQATETHIANEKNKLSVNQTTINETNQEIEYLEKKIASLKSKVDTLNKDNLTIKLNIEKLSEDLLGYQTVDQEYQAMSQKIANTEEINRKIRDNKVYYETKEQFEKATIDSENLTQEIKDLDDDIRNKIEASGLKGYSIFLEKDNIFVNNVEFDKLSTFEQLDFAMKVGLLIKSNHASRIVTMDVSQFDEDNRLKVVELAQEHGYQGIFEIATKNKSADGDVPTFLIEDGEAVEANQEVVA